MRALRKVLTAVEAVRAAVVRVRLGDVSAHPVRGHPQERLVVDMHVDVDGGSRVRVERPAGEPDAVRHLRDHADGAARARTERDGLAAEQVIRPGADVERGDADLVCAGGAQVGVVEAVVADAGNQVARDERDERRAVGADGDLDRGGGVRVTRPARDMQAVRGELERGQLPGRARIGIGLGPSTVDGRDADERDDEQGNGENVRTEAPERFPTGGHGHLSSAAAAASAASRHGRRPRYAHLRSDSKTRRANHSCAAET